MESFAQFRQRSGNTVVSENDVSPRIAGLLSWRAPFAVLLKIAKIIVDSLNSGVRWCFPHIRKKLSEVTPCVAHRNATTTVAIVLVILGIGAALQHISPNTVFSTSPHSVSSVQRTDAFDLGATTRGRPTDAQVALLGDEFFSARASTEAPIFHLATWQEGRLGFSDDFYSSKSFSDDYSFDRHNDGRFIVVFSSMLTASTVNCCDSPRKTTKPQGIYG